MKKSWILLIAIALVMVGCSQDGKLKVYNETLSDV
jgi:PBP1b-binding outer membrane lipoprotein LpoB